MAEPLFLVLGLAAMAALVGAMTWLARKPERGLFLVFFSSGILMTPHLPVVREKLTAVEIIMLLTWLALLLRTGTRSRAAPPLTQRQRLSLFLGAVFTLWVAFSFLFNYILRDYAPVLFVAGTVETLNYAYGYLMFLTVVLMVRDWETWRGCLNAWLLGAVVVSFFGVWATIGSAPAWTYDEFTGRVSSTLRFENQIPSFLLPPFVALVFMVVQRGIPAWWRLALFALLAGMVVTAIGTGSRTAFLMLFISAAGVLFVAVREGRRGAFQAGLLLNVSIAVFAALFVYVALALAAYDGDYALGKTPAWQRPVVTLFEFAQGTRGLDESRTEQMHFVWDNIDKHLLLGTGPKVYGGLYGVEEIHNTYTGILFQLGLVGFVLFMTWLLHVMWSGWRASKRITAPFQRVLVLSMLMGMGVLLLYSMTMFGLRQRNLWLLAGLLVAAISLVPRRDEAPPPPLRLARHNIGLH